MSPKATKGVAGLLCVPVLALLTFGFVMLASTSSSAGYHGDSFPARLKPTRISSSRLSNRIPNKVMPLPFGDVPRAVPCRGIVAP